jgi:hypothetical protein
MGLRVDLAFACTQSGVAFTVVFTVALDTNPGRLYNNALQG